MFATDGRVILGLLAAGATLGAALTVGLRRTQLVQLSASGDDEDSDEYSLPSWVPKTANLRTPLFRARCSLITV